MTACLMETVREVAAKKFSFFGLSVCVFLGSVLFLHAHDLLPSRISKTPTPVVSLSSKPIDAKPVVAPAPELPVSISIPKIALTASIENPQSSAIPVLDKALLSGAVRYPTSAKLGVEDGNVVLFGHSSYLPVVHNQAYKTFDGIQKLVAGDRIVVRSEKTTYVYVVRSMAKESAKNAVIPLSVKGRVLTLATCNSFGEKTDRFVVTADFVESHPIADAYESVAGG